MEAERTEKGVVLINGTLIKEEIFDEEKSDYKLVEREQQIDDLIDWISEAKERENDKYLMKEDLKYLIGLDDEYVFSSISTNEFIAQSDNLEEFNNICKELLKLNKK